MSEEEEHEHTEDETDNGRVFCRCGEFVRVLEREDYDTNDYWKDDA